MIPVIRLYELFILEHPVYNYTILILKLPLHLKIIQLFFFFLNEWLNLHTMGIEPMASYYPTLYLTHQYHWAITNDFIK
ncbi:hypothetical protein HanIR_Chr10g0499121 [Helianthus annuus]|nr:hypothetical protein HanIR_Chr10g0499121 [Helianthus annuus]